MLITYGAGEFDPYGHFDRYLDSLAVEASVEETADGFAYYNAPDLPADATAVGKVITGEGVTEIELFISSDIPAAIRPLLAQICVVETETMDPYTLANASNQVLRDMDPELRAQVGQAMWQNLLLHRNNISQLDGKRRFEETHPLTRQQLRSGLGWAAMNRPYSEKAEEAIARLEASGLYVPTLQSDEKLVVPVRKRRGGYEDISVTFAIEKGEKHRCADCQGQILPKSGRVTTATDTPQGGYDHHHHHPVCFAERGLGKLDLSKGLILPTKTK